MRNPIQPRHVAIVLAATLGIAALPLTGDAAPAESSPEYLFHDAHFHLTNYIQQGTDIHKYLEIMGDKVGRSTLFGIPLQQTWSYENSGDFAPTYYLQSDAPLYYYSFTDAFIANAYLKLAPEQRKRIDPMITGFNPADMYAADHIRRVLETYPGRVHGNRRVHDPQGVRLLKGRWRHCEPDRPGPRPPARLRGRGGARRDPAQRHRHAVRQGGCGARLPDADEGPAAPSPEDHDRLGPHGTRARRPPGAGPGEQPARRSAARGSGKSSNRS